MAKLIILQGIPGSGKTTWAKEFLKDRTDWVRINRDDLRNMRGDYWIPSQEGLITDWERACLEAAMVYGINIIYDSTNLNHKNLNSVLNIVSRHNIIAENRGTDNVYGVEYKMFDTPLDVCIERDSKRERPVGAAVITGFYNRYCKSE